MGEGCIFEYDTIDFIGFFDIRKYDGKLSFNTHICNYVFNIIKVFIEMYIIFNIIDIKCNIILKILSIAVKVTLSKKSSHLENH